MKKLILVLFFSILLCCCNFFQKSKITSSEKVLPLASVSFDMEQVGSSVFKISIENNVNVIVIEGENGILLIDSGYLSTSVALKDFLDSNFSNPVKDIILTHYHHDHCGGIEQFKGVNLYTTDFVANNIPALEENFVLSIVDSTSIDFQGTLIELFCFEDSHTKKDLLVQIPLYNVLLCGDILFADRFPYVDFEKGGNILVYLQNQKNLVDHLKEGTSIIGGHGRVYSKEEFSTINSRLMASVDIIKTLKQEGKTLKQIQLSQIVKDLSDLNWDFANENKWIETVYASI